MSDKLFLATEVHGLKPEPAPRRGSLRIFVFDSPRLRREKRSKNKVFAGATVLAAFVLVLPRGIESLLAARLPRRFSNWSNEGVDANLLFVCRVYTWIRLHSPARLHIDTTLSRLTICQGDFDYMPQFAANLHYLLSELPFLDRFEAAAAAARIFPGVERDPKSLIRRGQGRYGKVLASSADGSSGRPSIPSCALDSDVAGAGPSNSYRRSSDSNSDLMFIPS